MNSPSREQNVQHPSRDRRGAVLVVALICVMLATAILGSVLQITLSCRRQVRQQARAVQSAWLAEAGVERAAAQLRVDPAYTGETWNIPAEQLGGPDGGAVTITVAEKSADSGPQIITVRADYPSGQTLRVRTTKQIEIILPTSPAAEPRDTDESGERP